MINFHRFFKRGEGKKKRKKENNLRMIKYSIRRIVSVVSRIRASSLRHSDETPNNKSRHGEKERRGTSALYSIGLLFLVRRFRAAWKQRRSLTILSCKAGNVCSLTVDREMRIFFFLFSTPGFAWPGGDFVIENGETPHAGSTIPARTLLRVFCE